MNEPTKPRFTVDLEEIDRQLRRPSSPGRHPDFAEPLPGEVPVALVPADQGNAVVDALGVPPAAAPRDPMWAGGQGNDPLQELARIVGQEDPFQSLLGRSSSVPDAHASQPHSYHDEMLNSSVEAQKLSAFGETSSVDPFAGYELANNYPQMEPVPHSGQPENVISQSDLALSSGDLAKLARIVQANAASSLGGAGGQADAGSSYPQQMPVSAPDLRGPAYEEYAPPSYADPRIGYNQEYDFSEHDNVPPAKNSSRKKLLVAGSAILLLALFSAVGYGYLRGKGVLTSGEPPLITASGEPTKVAPDTPDGKEFPDQNKQIYQGNAKEGSTQVVNREEQPVDIREATGARNSPSSSDDVFGEARKVRTVSVRPDGSIIGEPSPLTTAQSPERRGAMPTPNSSIQIAPATPSVQATPSTPVTQSTVPTSSKPQQAQVVSGSQQTTPTSPTASRAAQSPAAVSSAGGAYVVQFGVSASEAEGRTRFNRLKTQFPSVLANVSPSIFAAEVNGRTLYRIRTTGMSKEAGDSLCGKFKDAGGECFVTRN